MLPLSFRKISRLAANGRGVAAFPRCSAVGLLGFWTLLAAGLAGCGSGFNATVVPNAGSPNAVLSATALSFGQATVGTTATASVTLSNSGTGTLASVSLTLSDSKNFAFSSTCGTTLAAGASCTLTVVFQPTGVGAFNAALALGGNAADLPLTISLSGTGLVLPLPQALLSPGSLSFSGTVGSASATQAVTLTNTGTAALLVTGIVLSDTIDFKLASTCGPSVSPAASCTLSILFQPQTRGALSATLTVEDNAGGVSGSTQSVTLTGTAIPTVSTVMNFGDSITCGYYALPQDGAGYILSTQGYAGVLDTTLAKPSQNLCRPGDQAADMTRLWVYPNAVPQLGSQQLYTVLIGTNDAHACGGSAGCLTNWSSALQASLVWLALPATDKVLGSAVSTRTGAWTADFYGIGTMAVGPGATLTFPVTQTVAGRTLYLGYRAIYAPGYGSAAVAVDGVAAAVLVENVNTGQPIYTQNGTADTVFVAGVPLGAVGQHTVTLTTTSAGAAPFTFLWAGVSSGNYASALNAPRVLIGGVPATPSAALQSTVDTYNALLAPMVAQLTADGMDVEIVPTAGALNTSTDFVDILHPNTAGHAKLAAAFLSVLP